MLIKTYHILRSIFLFHIHISELKQQIIINEKEKNEALLFKIIYIKDEQMILTKKKSIYNVK